MTFVSVGNATQPFNRLLDQVLRISSKLPQPVVVQYGNSLFQGAGCIPRQFMEMAEFSQFISEAELLILHAGAGSVINAIQAGKIPVVMPRRAKYGELLDDHQLAFARALAGTGKVVLAEEPDDLIDAVTHALSRQRVMRVLHESPTMIALISEVLSNYAAGLGK